MDEYKSGFEAGIHVTIDNVHPLLAWPQVFKGKTVFVRLDPGEGRGHHKFVRTAGARSKFGIYPSQIDLLLNRTEKLKMRIAGLHAHVGSNIFKPETWGEIAEFLFETAKRFKDVITLDLGGGLGVMEMPSQEALDISAVESELNGLKRLHPGYELWLEPGRFLVAEAGVILARVTQTKQKDDHNFIGLNVGMNSLIRPALYGAHHEIVNLSRLNERPSVIANIVGPICESSDVLGHSRFVAAPREGDVFLIAAAGAYGRSMSSTYNLREPAKERVIF
jgi:diaminopimelate decarboxylase/aspartate kinase